MSSRFGHGPGRARLQLSSAAALLAVVALAAGCTSDDNGGPLAGASGSPAAKGGGPAASVRAPDGCTTVVDADTPARLSVAVSKALFDTAPVVVVARADDDADLRAAAEQARTLGAPLLVTGTVGTTTTAAATASTSTPTAAPAAETAAASAETDSADCAEAAPSPTPTATPTATGSPEPTGEPTSEATDAPTDAPTDEATAEPTDEPTASATPLFTPAAFTVATADAQACSPAKSEPAEKPAATATPDATTGTPSASPTATSTSTASPTASAGPTATATPSATATPGATATTEPSPADAPLDPAVAAEISRLQPKAILVLDAGVAEDVRAALPAAKVVDAAGELPSTSTPAPLSGLTVLVPNDDDTRAGGIAAEATALAAGARAIGVQGEDPRADECAIKELSGTPATQVLAAGDFGPADRLADRMAVVATGVELPGGGQLFFPGRRLIALYGYPNAPELGVLGAQSISASIDRAKQVAAPYDSLSDVPVVPTFEVITTVAQGVPGRDGDYSAESSVDAIRPYVEQAGRAGLYVILDLQPGRSDFLRQAKLYEELLKLPHVGLALDPEWRLKSNQVHLRQIGSVDASEINRVSDWLAALTAEYRLPQKLLVLHQFSLTMITNRASLDTSHDELALLIHMDGQGQPIQKEGTWRIVTNTIPEDIYLGWKNFYKKDTRVMTPEETLDRERQPVMISYQ